MRWSKHCAGFLFRKFSILTFSLLLTASCNTKEKSSPMLSSVAPPDPSSPSAIIGSTQIALSWAGSDGATKSYKVTFQSGAVAPKDCHSGSIVTSSSASTLITGLNSNTQYSFRVCSLNSNSDASPGITFAVSTAPYAGGTIVTMAGMGFSGGDGGQSTGAALNFPSAVVMDSSGNLYIADTNNNKVRKVSASGLITTVAGNGSSGYSGDGGPAASAKLYYPSAVAIDSAGNLFIADTNNHRIRKVDGNSGNISTVAGNGTGGYAGDNGPAVSARLNSPSGIAIDSDGDLYIADTNNHRIRKVDSNGDISTVAGTGTAGYDEDGPDATSRKLNRPVGVLLDSSDNLYIADSANNRIRMVDGSGIISTLAGNGSGGYSGDGRAATSAKLYNPVSIAMDPAGNFYIADMYNSRIRMVDMKDMNRKISTVAGKNGSGFSGDGDLATNAMLNSPSGISVDSSGNLYINDKNNHRIRKMESSSHNISTYAGNGTYGFSGDGGLATKATLYSPSGIHIDSSGNIYVADTSNHRIRKVDAGGIIATVAGNGLVGYSGDGMATNVKLSSPSGIAGDSSGNFYIADSGNHRVRKVDVNGKLTTVAGNGAGGYSGDGGVGSAAQINSPSAIALDRSGNLFIADKSNHAIRKLDASGNISTFAGATNSNGSPVSGYSGDGGVAIGAQLNSPSGVAVDSSGNVYIADTGNHRLRRVDTNGKISTVAGYSVPGSAGDGGAAIAAQLNSPSGVALDDAGNIYIADSSNHLIRKIDANGMISTVAGNITSTLSSDGGLATVSQLSYPTSVAVDGAGNLYIADKNSLRIRKVWK
ncbi:MAG: SMP-30/gluconolactonase/LRE family protein [Deltaproteobacteria bacterium]|nr:SMP-30/gluconolactonase/LRE family protein [Deltaproteobacteria bacterium]